MDSLEVPFQDNQSRLSAERRNTLAKIAVGGLLVAGWIAFLMSPYADFGEAKVERRLARMNPSKRRR